MAFKGHKYIIEDRVRFLYQSYFNQVIDDAEDRTWVPKVVCESCRSGLNNWWLGKGKISFGRAFVWTKPIDHDTRCYVCMTPTVGYSYNQRHEVPYAVNSTAEPTKPHGRNFPVPTPPPRSQPPATTSKSVSTNPNSPPPEHEQFSFLPLKHSIGDDNNGGNRDDGQQDPTFVSPSRGPHMITQGELMDLVGDLYLSKGNSEMLASRLKEWNLLARVSFYSKTNYKCMD